MHAPRVLALILDAPLTPARQAAALREFAVDPGGVVGAELRFEGVVRRTEPDGAGHTRDLVALDYQTYDPMAIHQLESLARDVLARHSLVAIAALHSRGRVPVGEASFVLVLRARHRAETLLAAGEFIDRLKQDVPIWKRPVWA